MMPGLKNFLFNTPMERLNLRMKIEHSPQDIILHYNLKEKVGKKGVLLVRVEKSMYGLAGSALALPIFVFWVCLGF